MLRLKASSALCVHELTERHAARCPENIAVTADGIHYTYGELNARANQLAFHLRKLGIGPDKRVALCFRRSFDLIVSIFAVLKAGGAYVPLDPTYPIERLAFMLSDSAPSVILTHSDIGKRERALLASLSAPVLDFDMDSHQWAHAPAHNPSITTLQPNHLAYVIYTSGSTGQPKGVMIEHRNLVNLVEWAQDWRPLSARDNFLQRAAYSFDASVFEIFWPLTAGARLVLPSLDDHYNVASLVGLMRTAEVSIAQLVPSVLQTIADLGLLRDCAHLKMIICGGETLMPQLAREVLTTLPDVPFYNFYGPTESTVWASIWKCSIEDAVLQRIPIGWPIPNVSLHVRRNDGGEAALGEVGELLIGGAQIARGYWNRPELTTERFIDAGDSSADRLYKTGDLVRRRDDDAIEFLGRNDTQVKLRGYRIELEEIEARIAGFAGVKRVAVVLEDQPEKQLCAYIAIADSTLEMAAPMSFPRFARNSSLFTQWVPIALRDSSASAPFGASAPTKVVPSFDASVSRSRVAHVSALAPTEILELGGATSPEADALLASFSTGVLQDVGGLLDSLQESTDFIEYTVEGGSSQERSPDMTLPLKNKPDTIFVSGASCRFADAESLGRFLSLTLERLGPNGKIYLTDLRNYTNLRAFYASIVLAHSPLDAKAAQVRALVDRCVSEERQLTIDPAFFYGFKLPSTSKLLVDVIRHVSDSVDDDGHYYYDVVLMVAGRSEPTLSVAELSGQTHLHQIEAILNSEKPPLLLVRGIGDRRLDEDLAALRLIDSASSQTKVGDLLLELESIDFSSESITEYRQLAKRCKYTLSVYYSAQHANMFDAMFCANSIPPPSSARTPDRLRETEIFAGVPLEQKRKSALTEALRKTLAAELPAYMIPADFVFAKNLPLSTNGKVDRTRLRLLKLSRYSVDE